MRPSVGESPKSDWLDSWHVGPSANRNYLFLDGLRGIAILLVIVCHLFYFNPQASLFFNFMGVLAMTGGHGVGLFFTLSGFLVSLPFWKKKQKGSARVMPEGYGWKRFWKVYPPLALSLAVLTPIYMLREGDWSYLLSAIQWLTGLSVFFPVSGKLNPVLWTLAVEVQFYLTLPLIFVAFRRVPAEVALWLITLLLILVPYATRELTGWTGSIYPYIFNPFPTALDSFALGVFVAGLESLGMLHKKLGVLGDVGLVLLPLALLTMGYVNMFHNGHAPRVLAWADWAFWISCGCLLFYAADPQNPRVAMLSAPWLCWCGIISYEWYLIHQPIFLWWRGALGPGGGNPLWYAAVVGGALVLGIGIAALFYRYFSLPILRYRRARLPEMARVAAV